MEEITNEHGYYPFEGNGLSDEWGYDFQTEPPMLDNSKLVAAVNE